MAEHEDRAEPIAEPDAPARPRAQRRAAPRAVAGADAGAPVADNGTVRSAPRSRRPAAARPAAAESEAPSPPAATRPPPSGAHPAATRPTPGATQRGAEARPGAAPRRQGRWPETSGRPARGGSGANTSRRDARGRRPSAWTGPAPGNVREREPERGRRGPIVDPRQRPRREDAASQPSRVGGGRVAVGTISELSRDRGFGFLVDGAGRKRFFHRSAVVDGGFDALRERQAVQFEPKDDVKGVRAVSVRP